MFDSTDALIFDLDGTLWDTCEVCAVAWNGVLERHRIAFRTITAADVRAVTGKPHEICIRQVFTGLPEEDMKLLIAETQSEDNRLIAERGGELYPGVREVLPRLAKRWPLFIVSNCQAGYIEVFLDQCGWRSLFTDFECWGNTGLSKTANLSAIIARNAVQHPVFIGDGPGDQEAAYVCGVPFVFASYGFGGCDRMQATVGCFSDLETLLPKSK